MAEIVHLYRYLRPSVLDVPHRHLGLETSGGTALARPAANPTFFTGFLASPGVAASALAAVARVARARYYEPSRSRALHVEWSGPAPLDPVVTCNGDRLRFESFSGCCGVYARLDVLSGALDGEMHDRGTTNVDISEPLRRMLARV